MASLSKISRIFIQVAILALLCTFVLSFDFRPNHIANDLVRLIARADSSSSSDSASQTQDTKTSSNSQSQSQSRSASNSQSSSQSNSQSRSASNTQSNSQSNSQSDSQSNSDSKSNSQSDSKSSAQSQSKSDSKNTVTSGTDIPEASGSSGNGSSDSSGFEDVGSNKNLETKTTSSNKSSAKSTDGSTITSDDNKSSSSSEPTSSSDTYDYDVSTSIDARLPAGGVTMLTPNPTETTYIKIGQFATFSWSYTSLSVTPRYLNFQAYCSYNSETYTIATDHPAMETEYVWDTKGFQANATIPLLTSNYMLYIYDSKKNVTSVPSAGYLGVFSQKFSLYTPQAYTPLSDWTCVNCKENGGMISQFVDPTIAKWLAALVCIFIASTIQTIVL